MYCLRFWCKMALINHVEWTKRASCKGEFPLSASYGACVKWIEYFLKKGKKKRQVYAPKEDLRDQFLQNLVRKDFVGRWLWIWKPNYEIQNGGRKLKSLPIFTKFGMLKFCRSLIMNLKSKLWNSKWWMKIKNATNFYKIWYAKIS